ncbi:hypothetical protein [Alkalihalobacillus sp. LMS39]|nr:hypothetical protein [Alkalihalobacillus sp. LMS39]UOE93398.1 hypothetical protein MM271_19740 [Alkalihalobacillus sp. LMS39]
MDTKQEEAPASHLVDAKRLLTGSRFVLLVGSVWAFYMPALFLLEF